MMTPLDGMMGVPRCCACDRSPEHDAPLYRINSRDAPGPLWCCGKHYILTLLRNPGPNTEMLTVEDLT